MFSRATLPAITVHEVAPGHFAHGRRLRTVTSDVRRTLHSLAFVEGWAHYGEEVCVEEGFREQDPRFAAGSPWRRCSGSPAWPPRSAPTPAP